MSASQKSALTSTSSSSGEDHRHTLPVIARMLRLLVMNISAAEINVLELVRPHRLAQLTAVERAAVLRVQLVLRGQRRIAEVLENRWKARQASSPKS